MASRLLLRPQLLQRSGVRFQSTGQSFSSEFAKQRDAVKHHAGESAETWKKISLFVCIPALLAAGVNAYNLAAAHEEHLKHHPREFINYEYRNWRCRDNFWGKNSLFFNPAVNQNLEEE